MKTCAECGESLALAGFGTTSRGGYERRCRVCVAESRRTQKHGVTLVEREFLVQSQGGCAICGRAEPGGKGWVIDHDHACCPGDKSCEDCRRGVLCQWCNNILGYAFDQPETLRRAADYVGLATRLLPTDWGQSTDSVKRLTPLSHTYETDVLTERRAVVTDVNQVAVVDAGRANESGGVR